MGLDGSSAQVIDGVGDFIIGYALIGLVREAELELLILQELVGLGRAVGVGGDYAVILERYLAQILKFQALGETVLGGDGRVLAESGGCQQDGQCQCQESLHCV